MLSLDGFVSFEYRVNALNSGSVLNTENQCVERPKAAKLSIIVSLISSNFTTFALGILNDVKFDRHLGYLTDLH